MRSYVKLNNLLQNNCKYRSWPKLLQSFATYVILCLFMAETSFGFWPFTSKKEEDYIARVGDEVILFNDYLKSIDRLHSSDRAGQALSRSKSFAKQDFRKLLNEKIDQKLKIVEARNMDLDKDPDFISEFESKKLNLALEKLRDVEIFNKISIENGEIEDYFINKSKKDNKSEADSESDDVSKKEIIMEYSEREAIRRILTDEKTRVREKEYFEELRKKAAVKVYEDNLKDISWEKKELYNQPLADVGGSLIIGFELLQTIEGSGAIDENIKRETLERLILYRALDNEAIRRGYDKDKDVMEKVKKINDEMLIDHFQKKVILSAIKVSDKDIQDFYEDNKANYLQPDSGHFRVIVVSSMDEALEILADLKAGADVSYLVETRSIDATSKKNGGDLGNIPLDRFPEADINVLKNAEKGDYFGPYKAGAGYGVYQFIELVKGEYAPLGAVRDSIDIMIGRFKFNDRMSEYMARLRQVVKIKINEEKMRQLEGNP